MGFILGKKSVFHHGSLWKSKAILIVTALLASRTPWTVLSADAWIPPFSSTVRSSCRRCVKPSSSLPSLPSSTSSSSSSSSIVVQCSHSTTQAVEVLSGAWNSTQFGDTGCWGRRPLLLKRAFMTESVPSDDDISSFSMPTWEEILNLACCTNIDSNHDNDQDMLTAESSSCPPRLIRHQPGALDSFSLEFGPFKDAMELSALLCRNDDTGASTLVVNDVDRWIPDLSDWMDATFDRLPRWRRDDAQISLADVGGGIGPHVDNYDVFLIQSSGHREWEIGLEPLSVQWEFDHLVEASQVRILQENGVPTVKLQLGPGDCLYLPPRFQHCGTATSANCVTLSVGCRAPSAAEVLSKVAESIASSARDSAVDRYSDRNLHWEDHPPSTLSSASISNGGIPIHQLTDQIKNEMKALVRNLVEDILSDETMWDNLVGQLVTEPNRPVLDYPMPLYELDDEWRDDLGVWGNAETAMGAVLAGTGVLRRAEGVSFAWSAVGSRPHSSTTIKLYAQGRSFSVDSSGDKCVQRTKLLLERICSGKPISKTWLEEEMDTAKGAQLPVEAKALLEKLLDEGLLYGDDSV